MAVKIELKRSAVPGKVPTVDQLDLGEMAINTYDGKVYFKQDTTISQSIVELATTAGSGSSVVSASHADYADNAGNASTANFATTAGTATSASYSLSGSFAVTSSYAINTSTASYVLSASYATTASYALTSSYATDFTVENNLVVGNSITASNALFSGTITAQQLVVQYITASTEFITGSTKFGSQLTDTHQFTGSVSITGSLSVNGDPVITSASYTNFSSSIAGRATNLEATASTLTNASASFAQQSGSNSIRLTNLESTASVLVQASASFSSSIASLSSSFIAFSQSYNTGSFTGSFNGYLFGTASWAVSASHAPTSLTASYAVSASHADASDTAISSSYSLSGSYALTASFALNIPVTSSHAITASYAISASEAAFLGGVPKTTFATTASNNFFGVQNINSTSSVSEYVTFFRGSGSGDVLGIGVDPVPGYGAAINVLNSGLSDYAKLNITATDIHLNVDSPYGAFLDSLVINQSGSTIINNGLTVNNNSTLNGNVFVPTGIVYGTASWAISASHAPTALTSSFAVSASYSVSASYALSSSNAISASYALSSSNAVSSSYALSSSNAVSASYALSSSNAVSSSYALSSSNAVSASYSLSGSNSVSSSYALTASYALNIPETSSFAISASYAISSSNAESASYAITASNALLLNGTASSVFATTGSNIFSGSQAFSGSLRLDPTADPGNVSSTATFLFVSGSNTALEDDLYFRQNGNLTKWKWIEGQLQTGLLYGGALNYSGSTIYVNSGSGIIMTYGASYGSEISPIAQYINWGPITASAQYLTSSNQTYAFIDSSGNLQQQTSFFAPDQYQNAIPLGVFYHADKTAIRGTGGDVATVYNTTNQSFDFIRAFGPLKLEGLTLNPISSSLSLSVGAGIGYVLGGFYQQDQNNVSHRNINAVPTCSFSRWYRSGSGEGFTADTNGGSFYTTIDNQQWDNGSGTLATVGNGNWTIQRVFINPTGIRAAVYYGQKLYTSLADAQSNINSDPFNEATLTAHNNIFAGYLIVQGNASNTDLANTTVNAVVQSGLFRNTVGGSGGTTFATTLESLSDVNVNSPTNGQALIYNGGLWENGTPLNATTASYVLNAVSASFAFSSSLAVSSSYALSSSYAVSASHAPTSLTASFAVSASYAVSSSNAVSSSYAISASHAPSSLTASFATTSSYAVSSSNAESSSYAISSSNSISSSFAQTASYVTTAQTASYVVSSSYAVTSSYSLEALSASFAAFAISSSFATTASFALNGGGGGGISAIYIADEGILQGTASYFDFIGTGVSASVSAGTASITITGGGGGTATQGASQVFTQSIAANTWSFAHSVNSQTPVVEIYDLGYNTLIPTRIYNPGPFATDIYFDVAQNGYAIISTGGVLAVTGSNAILNQTLAATTWSFTHDLHTQYPVFTIYDINNDVIIPQRINVVSTSSADIYFSTPRTGKAVASLGGGSNLVSSSISSSYADFALSASFATSASYALSSSYSISSSYSLSSSYAISSSNAVSSSYALSSSYAVSSSNALTASYFLTSSVTNATSASYAATASSADSFLVRQDITASNALITGTVTAQTLVIQTITSSVIYSSGSNIFGNQLSNTQQLTGSVTVTGSLDVNGFRVVDSSQTASMSVLSSSYAQTASYFITSSVTSASYAATASTSVSSSYALTASYALNGGGGGGISAIYIADEGTLQGTASYFDFTGAGVTATVNAGTASINITGGGSTSAGQSTTFTQSVAADPWTFVHNLNTRTPLIQVYDTSFNQITPQYISASNAQTVIIGFGIPTAGYAVGSTGGTLTVTGSNVILDQQVAATTWSFNHNLNTQYPVFQVFNTANEVIVPQNIVATTTTSSLIYFPTPVAGKAVASVGGLSGSITASYAVNALSSSYSLSGSYALTASFALNGGGSGTTAVANQGTFIGTASYFDFVGNNISASVVNNTASITVIGATGTSALTQSVAAATWSFTHNLNTYTPLLQVYDASYNQLIPNVIVGTTPNVAEIRFDYSQSGYAVASNGGGLTVSGSTAQLNQTVGALTWSFAHNLNSKYVNFEVYDSNDFVVIPANIQVVDSNNANLYFATATTGTAIAMFSGINGAPNATSASFAVSASSAVSASFATTASYLNPITNGYVVLTQVSQSLNFVDDTAAAAGGVPLGGLYRNGNFISIRIA